MYKEEPNFDETQDLYQKRERYISRILIHYWRRWISDYSIDLREYHSIRKSAKGIPVVTEDVVLVKNENLKNRIFWRLRRIDTLITGHDGIVRGAQVILSNGNKIERPIQ